MNTQVQTQGLIKATSAPQTLAQEGEPQIGHLASAGFGYGGLVGAVIGAAAMGIAALSAHIVLPGSGAEVAGPLSAMLLGAGAGAANGGLAGALIGWGIPVERTATASRAAEPSVRNNLRTSLCANCK